MTWFWQPNVHTNTRSRLWRGGCEVPEAAGHHDSLQLLSSRLSPYCFVDARLHGQCTITRYFGSQGKWAHSSVLPPHFSFAYFLVANSTFLLQKCVNFGICKYSNYIHLKLLVTKCAFYYNFTGDQKPSWHRCGYYCNDVHAWPHHQEFWSIHCTRCYFLLDPYGMGPLQNTQPEAKNCPTHYCTSKG